MRSAPYGYQVAGGPRWFSGVLLLLSVLAGSSRSEEVSGNGVEFFEKRIRPLLSEHCYKCHSAQSEKLKGGLRLDARELLLKGGDSGPAVVPGEPEKSLLIKAIGYTDPDLQMPPKNEKLSDRQISDLLTWVKMGAPWPAEGHATAAKAAFEITQKDRAWWAFQPIQRAIPPVVRRKTSNPIDSFLIAELQARALEPNGP